MCSHTASTISDSTTPAQSLASEDLFGDFVSVPVTGVSTGGAVPQGVESSPESDLLVDGSGAAGGAEPKKSTKESIMALYGPSASSANQQQMFGIPGTCSWWFLHRGNKIKCQTVITASAPLELGLILNSGNVFTLLGFCFSDAKFKQWVKVHGKPELFINLILCNNM